MLATSAGSVGVWDWNIQSGEFYLDPNIKGFLGYQDHEISNDLDVWVQYIHPDDKDAVMKAAQDTIEGRSSEYVFEHRMIHKDGSIRWFMVRGQVIRDAEGRPMRFVGTDTDITSRRELERQVRELSNEVQTRIGHDLHDSLGQDLTGLALKLRSLEVEAASDGSPYLERIGEARRLTENAIRSTEALSRGLSPILSYTGLALGLRQLADNAMHFYDITCGVALPEDLPDRLSDECGNELYRIVQEAVTNAVKHGRATHVDITGEVLDRHFVLSISDNGTGIDESLGTEQSFGLKIMHYRARHLGGSLAIKRRPDGGTSVLCTCPIPE